MKEFILKTQFSMSYYVLTDMDYDDFDLTDALDFLEEKLDEGTYAKIEFIEEEESVAQYYNYKYCLVFHDTANVDKEIELKYNTNGAKVIKVETENK